MLTLLSRLLSARGPDVGAQCVAHVLVGGRQLPQYPRRDRPVVRDDGVLEGAHQPGLLIGDLCGGARACLAEPGRGVSKSAGADPDSKVAEVIALPGL